MKKLGLFTIAFSIIVLVFSVQSCKQIQGLANAVTNMQRLQFKLSNVSNMRIAGIDLSSKRRVSDLNLTDAAKITSAIATRKLQSDFILNVEAKNPNGTTAKNTNTNTNASLTGFDWRLIIDDVPTIAGNIASPVTVPGQGQTAVIPLGISLDLYEFFGKQGYDRIINLALAIGGAEGSSSRLKLDAKPTVKIGSFPITYPGRITIVNTEFRD